MNFAPCLSMFPSSFVSLSHYLNGGLSINLSVPVFLQCVLYNLFSKLWFVLTIDNRVLVVLIVIFSAGHSGGVSLCATILRDLIRYS